METAFPRPARPPGAAGPSQRRVQRRLAHRVPCSVRLTEAHDQEARLPGETVNVSATGIAVQVAAPIVVGSEVEVTLGTSAGRGQRRLLGSVVHVRRVTTGRYEVGIQAAFEDGAP